jgi:hypothetical protein
VSLRNIIFPQELAHRTEVAKHSGRSIALSSLAIVKVVSTAKEEIAEPIDRGREQGKAS